MRATSGARTETRLGASVHWLAARPLAVRHLVAGDTGVGIAEAVAGALGLAVLGLVIPGHWGLLDVQPHPFWILVIAIAIRYGPTPGFVAAGVAAGCYAFFVWVGPGPHLRSPSPRELAQPFFLLVSGLLVGELVRSQHRYLTTLRHRSEATTEALGDLQQRQQALAEVNAELEKRIVTQSSSLIALYGIAKRLNVLDVQAVYAAILAVVREVFEATACAVYVWREGRLELQAGIPSDLSGREDTWDLETGLIGRAFRDARVVSIRERLIREGAQALADEPAMLAGPLLDREGRALGVVVVERLPFLKLNTASVRLFEMCLDWFSASLANAAAHQDMPRQAAAAELDGRRAQDVHAPTRTRADRQHMLNAAETDVDRALRQRDNTRQNGHRRHKPERRS